MRERDFEEYLLSDESIKSKMKAVNSRLSKARLIERELEHLEEKIEYRK